jgi:hypothetical protein
MTCVACRERLLMDEPCKLMRQTYAKQMEKWGEVPEWKKDPNCGCVHACKRRQYIHQDAKKQGKIGNAKF